MRKAFEADGGVASTTYTPPSAPEVDKELQGFRRMLASLARKGDDYDIKQSTADRVVALALPDDRKLAVLRESPVRARVVLAATPGEARDELAERVGIDIA